MNHSSFHRFLKAIEKLQRRQNLWYYCQANLFQTFENLLLKWVKDDDYFQSCIAAAICVSIGRFHYNASPLLIFRFYQYHFLIDPNDRQTKCPTLHHN